MVASHVYVRAWDCECAGTALLCVCVNLRARLQLQGVAELCTGVWELSFTGFVGLLGCVGAESAAVDQCP